MFDQSTLDGFSEEPLEGAAGEWSDYPEPSDYVEPPPPGKYAMFVDAVTELKQTQAVPPTVSATLTLEIANALPGSSVAAQQASGRRLGFQRFSSKKFARNGAQASTLDDLLYAAAGPVPTNNKEYGALVVRLADNKGRFGVKLDWRGFCIDCYNRGLMAATSTTDKEAAKQLASAEQRKVAAKAATVAKTSRGFKQLADGRPDPIMACPSCMGEVRADANIVTMFRLTPNA